MSSYEGEGDVESIKTIASRNFSARQRVGVGILCNRVLRENRMDNDNASLINFTDFSRILVSSKPR